MAIPPPPPGPPGPPPPPIGNLKLGAPAFGKSSGSGDARSALLQSIQKGAKLKKTTTVDKSGPIGAGRVAAGDANSGTTNTRSNSGAPTRPPPPNNGSAQMNGTPKLKGIFEGMSAMPKLKPVGGRSTGVTSPTIESPSSTSTGCSPLSTSTSNLNGTVDFNTELSRHLMMKKQMKPQQQHSSNEINTRNRGPPPQPPNKSVTDNNSSPTAANNSPLIKQSNSGSPTTLSSINGANITILPNKSALYGNSNNNNVNINTITAKMTSTTAATATSTPITTTTNKVVPNHGKPNCAPKPPGIQNIVTSKNGLSPLNTANSTLNNGNSNRPIVSRAHSMRSPRSPPITIAGQTFPAAQHFGTIRGTPAAFQSQDAINSVSMRPAPAIISRPTVAPPRPPTEAKTTAVKEKEQAPRTAPPEKRSQGRCKSPPPPPIRSISNTNLSTLPLSIAASPNLSSVANAAATTFGGSASNVSTLMNSATTVATGTGSANNLSAAKDRSPNVSTNHIAPPLPPHRSVPAPPPPTRGSSITPNSSSSNSVAPPVPQRHSSMRNSNGAQATIVTHQTVNVTTMTPNSSVRTVNRFVMDVDAKFGHSFHNVTEFPAPSPFTRFEKIYPSRNMKATTEVTNRKARAPSPPSMKVTNNNTGTTTNDKFYLRLTQDHKYYTDESSYC